jgi:peptidase E
VEVGAGGIDMKKLVLTSAGFDNKNIEVKFLDLVNIPKQKIKVLFIPTAAITEEQKAFIPLCKEDLLSAGILEKNIKTYDLDRIISSEELCLFNAIYVCGGTTEYLLKKINEVKFHKPLKDFLEDGGVYVWVSAGSIIMAGNLPNNLSYINCKLGVHCNAGSNPGQIDTTNCPDIKLTDDQAIIIMDDDISIIE